MQKKLIAMVAMAMVFSVMASATVYAADQEVACTVTVRSIALTVDPTSHAFGVMDAGAKENTYTGTAHKFTLTNSGNCKENFTTKGAATTAWTLAASQGSEEYMMKQTSASSTETESETEFGITLTTSPATLTGAQNVSANAVNYFDLLMGVPTSTAATSQQTATVTIGAIAALTD